MKDIKMLKQYGLAVSRYRTAEYWLAIIAFVENSIFLIPVDVLFLPLVMIKPKKTCRYILITVLFSVLGSLLGWLLGRYACENFARPVLEFYGKYQTFEHLRQYVSADLISILLVTSGFIHLPPTKIVAILSGALGYNIFFFIIVTICTRGVRFFLIAILAQRYGAFILSHITRQLKYIHVFLGVIMLIIGVLFTRLYI